MNEQQIYFGDALKALDDQGKVGGYLVRFTNSKNKDLDGEYFTDQTYYGPNDGNGSDTIFHHAKSLPVASTQLTPAIKSQLEKLKDHLFDPGTVKRDAVGLWAEVVLDMADEYESMVYDLVQKGKLGWSSGAVGHMVKVASDGKIERWPIGEKSFTPRPAEPQNRVLALKSLEEVKFIDFTKGSLSQAMSETEPSYYQLHWKFCEMVCGVAELAKASSELSESYDANQKIDQLVSELAEMSRPVLKQQVQDYVDGANEYDFYLKALEANAPFDLAVSAATKLVKALERNHDNRQKEGRMLSTANRKKLMTHMESMSSIMAEMQSLLDASEPKPKSADPEKIRSLRLTLLRAA